MSGLLLCRRRPTDHTLVGERPSTAHSVDIQLRTGGPEFVEVQLSQPALLVV
jgi:hypothetical protein